MADTLSSTSGARGETWKRPRNRRHLRTPSERNQSRSVVFHVLRQANGRRVAGVRNDGSLEGTMRTLLANSWVRTNFGVHRLALGLVAAMAIVLGAPQASQAGGWHGGWGWHGGGWHGGGWHGGTSVVIGFGAPVGFGWGAPFWGWPAPVAVGVPVGVPVAVPVPVAVQSQPQVFVQQAPPPQQQQQSDASGYWYYCQDPQGYFPYVRQCPGGWMQVVPQTTPPS